jgi:hypothetical protein
LVEGSVWVGEKLVRPRMNHDELWLLYRLVDHQYWLLRRNPQRFWDLVKVSKLRRKLLRDLNRIRKPEHRISARSRIC